MENELHNNAAKLASVTEERNRIEDRMSSLEAAHILAQDQANQLQVNFYIYTVSNICCMASDNFDSINLFS